MVLFNLTHCLRLTVICLGKAKTIPSRTLRPRVCVHAPVNKTKSYHFLYSFVFSLFFFFGESVDDRILRRKKEFFINQKILWIDISYNRSFYKSTFKNNVYVKYIYKKAYTFLLILLKKIFLTIIKPFFNSKWLIKIAFC